MKKILNFEIIEKLHESAGSDIYRAKKYDNNEIFLLKVLKTNNPSSSEIARFKQEYESIKKADVQGAIKVLDIVPYDEDYILVLENFDGMFLSEEIDSQQAPLKVFLDTAINLTKTVCHLHDVGISHKNITPSNILINTDSNELKLFNFGVDEELTHETQSIYDLKIVKNVLPFISPEQTGRMNRAVNKCGFLFLFNSSEEKLSNE